MTTTDEALTEQIAQAIYEAAWRDGTRLQDQLDYHQELYRSKAAAVLPIIRKAQAEALREAARYFAGGLHCADMRTTPEETVRDLNRRATEYETEETS